MLMANSIQAAVQEEAFPLVGMLRVVKFFSPSAPVRMYTNVNVFDLSKMAGMFTNLGVFSLPKTNDNATNIDIQNLSKPDSNATYLDVQNLSKPDIHLAKNLAEWLSKLVIETASTGVSLPVRTRDTRLPSVITVLNEARLTVIRVSNEARLGVVSPTQQLTIFKMASSAKPKLLKGYGARSQSVAAIKKGSTSNATLLAIVDIYQLFGSMPRLSSSRRNKRFIQPERLSSPSSCIAIDRRSYNSASKRNWTANRSFLLSLVDILNHQHVSSCQVDNVYQRQQKQNPVSADTPTGFLTTTVIISNEEAILNHITPQKVRHSHTLSTRTESLSFVWIIAAVRRDCQVIAVQIHHIEAESEQEARRSLAREHVTFFAGRIRKGAAHA